LTLETNIQIVADIADIDQQIQLLNKQYMDLSNLKPNTDEYDLLQKQLNEQILNETKKSSLLMNIKELELNKTNITSLINSNIQHMKDIETNILTKNNILSIDKHINLLQSEYDNLHIDKHIEANYQLLLDETNQNSQFQNNIIQLNTQLNQYKTDIIQLQTKYDQINVWIDIYNKTKNNIIHNSNIENQINDLKLSLKTINDNIKSINSKIIETNATIKKNNKNIQIIQSNIKELQHIQSEYDIYLILNKMSGRDGIQLYLLNQYLHIISSRINMILQGLIDKQIELKLDGETIDLNITSGNKQIYTISGMENLMLDIVFKIIFGQITIIPKCNLLFIDESISVLDKNRMASIDELFVFLKQYYSNVFLITHIKHVKNHINNHLDINRVGTYSLIFNLDNILLLNNIMKQNNSDTESKSESEFDTDSDTNNVVQTQTKSAKSKSTKSKSAKSKSAKSTKTIKTLSPTKTETNTETNTNTDIIGVSSKAKTKTKKTTASKKLDIAK
jgi:DNA repair exonuclease SbcCD ATPase subunit